MADMTWLDVARAVFPEADDATLGMYLWEYTGFPEFWRGDPVTECTKQLVEAKEAMARGEVFDLMLGWHNPALSPAPAAASPCGGLGGGEG